MSSIDPKNDPIINILLGDIDELKMIQPISSAYWSTRVKRRKLGEPDRASEQRRYENAIYKAKNTTLGQYVVIIAGRWSDNIDWEIRTRSILWEDVVAIDIENSQIAVKRGDRLLVTNGYQSINIGLGEKAPMNQPKVLREFAEQTLAGITTTGR